MRSLLTLVLNIIWLLTAGWSLFLGYLLAGILACILVVTIPFGLASFRIAGFVIWPFGREVVDTGRGGAVGTIGNVIWFVIAGWWLALGHVVTAVAQRLLGEDGPRQRGLRVRGDDGTGLVAGGQGGGGQVLLESRRGRSGHQVLEGHGSNCLRSAVE